MIALAAAITLGCGGEQNQTNARNHAQASQVAAPQSGAAKSAVKPALSNPSIQIGDIDSGSFCYAETINPTASVSDIKAAYNPNNWLQTITSVYERRWPSGKALAQIQANDQYFKSFVDTSSFNKLAESLMVAMHEETHVWDLASSRTQWNTYTSGWIDNTYQFSKVPLHDGFPRKEILSLIKDDASSDMDNLYLKDATQAEYHLQGVTAELNAGLMGLPAAFMVAEYIDGIGASNSRDIALTNMSYLQLYLRIAKANHTDYWNKIKSEPALRKWVLVQFLRMSYWIDLSTPYASKLGGPKVPALINRVYAAENLAILEEFTGYKFPKTVTDHCMGSGTPTAPVISSQPQAVTASIGQSVSFSVSASGSAQLTYQWRKNGSNIATNASAASYTIPSVQASDAGAYSVVVGNSVGNVTSASANLTVNPVSVSVAVAPSSVTLQTGASQTFVATVSGTSSTGVTWSVVEAGGGNISNAGAYTAPNTVGTYHVKAVSLADSSKSAQATVTVTGVGSVPVITSQPQDITVAAGNSASFSVAASGSSPISYQWRKNGANIAGANAASYSVLAQAGDNGATFSVVVSNSLGSATSRAATLSVAVAGGSDLIQNGGFESGTSNWVGSSGVIGNFSSRGHPAFEGVNAAWFGGAGSAHTETLYQQVTIPASATSATLSFQLAIDTAEQPGTAYDKLVLQVQNSAGTVLGTLASYSNLNAASGYVARSFNLLPYKGQNVRIYFKMTEDAAAQTSFVVDKVSLKVQ
jgi:hypothetical protein